MPTTTQTIPHIELCLWYSEAIQDQETDSRRIVLYSLIFPSPSKLYRIREFQIVEAQEINFKLAFPSFTKAVSSMASSRPRRNKKELSLRTGGGHSGALYYSRTLMARLPRLFRTRSWVPWKKSLRCRFRII